MYSGNAVVVNFLMRFPVLIPIAVATGITAVVPAETPPPVPVPVVAKGEPASPPVTPPIARPLPDVPKQIVLKPVEPLCPPATKLTKAELNKLTPKERGLLKVKGCIKG
jgi:hypothetical protein